MGNTKSKPQQQEPLFMRPGYGFEMREFVEDDGSYVQSREIENPVAPLYCERDKVPQLPLPTLESSLSLLLQSCKPLAESPEEFSTLQRICEEMLLPSSSARALHAKLEQLAEKCNAAHTSWFISFWNKYAYLQYRDSVAHNVSYHLLLQDEALPKMQVPMLRAARFIFHATRYCLKVCQGELEPDRNLKTLVPFDNSQHKFLFHCCRIPGKTQDTSRLYDANRFPNVCVARNGRYFLLPVVDRNVEEIYADLDRICELADSAEEGEGVGFLTSQNRDDWFKDRNELLKRNGKALQQIESSAFLVCLDGGSPRSRRSVAAHMLDANVLDAANRFWDKSSQIIVSENGKIAYVAEHSMCDGVTTARFVNEILEDMANDSDFPEGVKMTRENPKEIQFKLSSSSIKAIARARATYSKHIENRESDVLVFHGYGAEQIKTKFKLSPDAFAQMAMQCASRRVFGKFVATYESTQTRTFAQGRTEVTRVVSEDSKRFCEALLALSKEKHTRQEMQQMLQQACKTHGEYVQKAVRGFGCDRHLLALRLIGSSDKSTVEKLFLDPLFVRSGRWELSTSGLLGERIDGWSFGEVVPTGVGIAYSVMNSRLRFTITSATRNKNRLAGQFCRALEEALVKMQELFDE